VSDAVVLDVLTCGLSSEAAPVLEADAVGGDEVATFASLEIGVLVSVEEVEVEVEVELTKGDAFSIYEPFACRAYWPTSRSPLGVS